jgi:hypothetical protein
MHDTDGNNKLDGCELVKSLIHWHGREEFIFYSSVLEPHIFSSRIPNVEKAKNSDLYLDAFFLLLIHATEAYIGRQIISVRRSFKFYLLKIWHPFLLPYVPELLPYVPEF